MKTNPELQQLTNDLLKQQEHFWLTTLEQKNVPESAKEALLNNIEKQYNLALQNIEQQNKVLLEKYNADVAEREKIIKQAKEQAKQQSKIKTEKTNFKEFSKFLDKFPVVAIKNKDIFLDTTSQLLWYIPQYFIQSKNDAYNCVTDFNFNNGTSLWRISTVNELEDFIKKGFLSFQNYHTHWWTFDNGSIRDNDLKINIGDFRGRLILVNNSLKLMDRNDIFEYIYTRNLTLCSTYYMSEFKAKKQIIETPKHITNITIPPEVKKPQLLQIDFQTIKDNIANNMKLDNDFINAYKYNDQIRCDQEPINDSEFTDTTRGVWELFGIDETILNKAKVFARDPKKDIKTGVVGIDFGTSSTVVAWNDNTQIKLIRVGSADLNNKACAEDYENPTILEFFDYEKLLNAWQETEKKPLVKWEYVNCSHNAKNSWRGNQGDVNKLASIFPKLKQWALKTTNTNSEKIYLKDSNNQQNFTIETISNELLENNLKFEWNEQQKCFLNINQDYPFDPIELYAWFLGLNINRRNQGVFLRYNLSMPVAYPKDAKERIRAAFERGLYRSLPETLDNEIIRKKFAVKIRDSEPSAYVVGAYRALDIQLTEEGCYYGVFDFGGGTMDFDYGLMRQTTEEEYEQTDVNLIITHFGEGDGDRYLGGENLIEHLAYETFKLEHNLELCRQHKISFTKPIDAKSIAGAENLIQTSRIAATNSLILATQLRTIFEEGTLKSDTETGALDITLLDNNEQKQLVKLKINIEDLIKLLHDKIFKGIYNFFVAMKKSLFDNFQKLQQSNNNEDNNGNNFPQKIHIFLAGNAARSEIVKYLFGLELNENSNFLNILNSLNNNSDKNTNADSKNNQSNKNKIRSNCKFSAILSEALTKLFGEKLPDFEVHSPLNPDENNAYAPTAKTAVAIGLVMLDGNDIEVLNQALSDNNSEAPFDFYVGKLDRNRNFKPILDHKSNYNEWKEFGFVRNNVVNNIYYTQLSDAVSGNLKEGDSGIYQYDVIEFEEVFDKSKTFIRTISPTKIEICAAENIEVLEEGNHSEIQTIELKI